MQSTNVVRTAAAGRIQTSQYVDLPVSTLQHSTLNEKYDIATTEVPPAGALSAVRYAGIGIGGHAFSLVNNMVKWETYKHSAKHAAMFRGIPFFLRRLSEGITQAELMKYRMIRVERLPSGEEYIAAYLRVLDKTQSTIESELRQVRDGVTTTSPLEYSLSDLSPKPPILNEGLPVTTTGDYVATTTKVPFTMAPNDIAEVMNVIELLYGDPGYAVISEFCTVAGIDKGITNLIGNKSMSYNEAIRAQVTSFVSTGFVVEHLTDGFTLNLDIGNVEPLLTVA